MERDLVKEQCWRDMDAGWRASGLTKSEFCRQHNVKLNVFCGWQKTIVTRDAFAERQAVRKQAARKKRATKERKPARNFAVAEPSRFVEVTVSGNGDVSAHSVKPGDDQIEVVVLKVKLPASCDSKQLLTVLEALR